MSMYEKNEAYSRLDESTNTIGDPDNSDEHGCRHQDWGEYGDDSFTEDSLDESSNTAGDNYNSDGQCDRDQDTGDFGNERGDGDDSFEEDSEHSSEEEVDANICLVDEIIINGLADILKIDMKNISTNDVSRYDFGDLETTYLFYCWYARMNGFSVRRSKLVRNSKGEKLQQTFCCSNEGYREDKDKGLNKEGRKRQQRRESRCGCEAKFRVHTDIQSGRWYVTVFNDEHNHDLVEDPYCSLLPGHRKMTKSDILQIENFRKAGIRPCQMYGAFANISRGYRKIRFRRKGLCNQVSKQKRQQSSDASAALKFLKNLEAKDSLMFVRHTVDDERRLKHLFWCDGESRMNYKVFGDVLAFDATYRKLKYMCPFVVFSGVNHHNQTTIFATALVRDETEGTYVWLLEQFMEAMEGKAPISVITDGDLAMKNAISKVFPEAHHRLCAWHLLRNAVSKVGIPYVMSYLKKCMLGDIEVCQFEETWDEMITKFGLEDNSWIRDHYEKRTTWATALMRGNFFASIRTTSQCEALHNHIGKFVHSRCNLTDFVEQFHRCLTYFRFREVEADFESNYGQFVLETGLRSLERFASRHFTNAIFCLVRKTLSRALLFRVVECHEMAMYSIYLVTKYKGSGTVWHVSFFPSPVEIICSCQRMESIGLPCEHILAVLVSLDYDELPGCLVLARWSKTAKEAIRASYTDGSFYWDSHLVARLANLHFLCREIAEVAHVADEDYEHIVNLFTVELNKLKHRNAGGGENIETETIEETIQDPPIVRTKGCGPSTTGETSRARRIHKCRSCGASGHNRRSCPIATGVQDSDDAEYGFMETMEDSTGNAITIAGKCAFGGVNGLK